MPKIIARIADIVKVIATIIRPGNLPLYNFSFLKYLPAKGKLKNLFLLVQL